MSSRSASTGDERINPWVVLGRTIGMSLIGAATGATFVAVIDCPVTGWQAGALAAQLVLCIGVFVRAVADGFR